MMHWKKMAAALVLTGGLAVVPLATSTPAMATTAAAHQAQPSKVSPATWIWDGVYGDFITCNYRGTQAEVDHIAKAYRCDELDGSWNLYIDTY